MFLLLAVRDMQSMWVNEITEFDMMSTMDESCDDDDDDGKRNITRETIEKIGNLSKRFILCVRHIFSLYFVFKKNPNNHLKIFILLHLIFSSLFQVHLKEITFKTMLQQTIIQIDLETFILHFN